MNLINAESWSEEMDVQVTVCDLQGVIVYMNKASAMSMHKYGGYDLIGKSLYDCHSNSSNVMIKEMQEHPYVNVYIVEKNGERKLIRQFPWEEDGVHKGIIEFSFPVPIDIKVNIRG